LPAAKNPGENLVDDAIAEPGRAGFRAGGGKILAARRTAKIKAGAARAKQAPGQSDEDS